MIFMKWPGRLSPSHFFIFCDRVLQCCGQSADSHEMLRIRQITRLPEKVSPPDRGGES